MRALLVALAVIALLAGAGWLWPQLRFQAAAQDVDGSAPDSILVMDGRVTRVIDGDTLDVQLDSGPQRIRLYGIDTPEARAPGGREATQALKRLLAPAAVEVQPVSDDPYDQYDRLIAVLYVGRLNVNEQMVTDGHAWAFRRYLGQLDGDEHYCELEAAARTKRRGLWSLPSARWVPPWIWRERQRASPGSRVPSRDYAGETAQDCIAAIGKANAPPGKAMPQGLLGQDTLPGETASSGQPPGCDIKGNINSKGDRIYHLPGSRSYAGTRINPDSGERWFCSEDEARAAGWRAPR
ncbi:MAG: hypothetical protein AMXMBFR45_23660 [Gammaproteobacteria bacterium]|nr:MAG: hypothetical protein EDM71_06180 [Pseudomonadota bacterium]MBC6944394.1 hypothetical protein [Gammaproteobacteria bacterium]MCE7895394.1 hypothetical protein [Gammaproteobacteria bacterium PRO8]MDL1881270.1 hypothetical protein [Gammaproteobacteria bacterium PRO2]MCQ3934661.1 hypothetical protein [Gammaproteobacteria bacterium]